MWWIIILAVITLILLRFVMKFIRQLQHVKQQGGMKVKYNTLINNILANGDDFKITSEQAISVIIIAKGITGYVSFNLTQSFGFLYIKCVSDSLMYEKWQLEWSFNENMDQNLMFEKINRDMMAQSLKLMSK